MRLSDFNEEPTFPIQIEGAKDGICALDIPVEESLAIIKRLDKAREEGGYGEALLAEMGKVLRDPNGEPFDLSPEGSSKEQQRFLGRVIEAFMGQVLRLGKPEETPSSP